MPFPQAICHASDGLHVIVSNSDCSFTLSVFLSFDWPWQSNDFGVGVTKTSLLTNPFVTEIWWNFRDISVTEISVFSCGQIYTSSLHKDTTTFCPIVKEHFQDTDRTFTSRIRNWGCTFKKKRANRSSGPKKFVFNFFPRAHLTFSNTHTKGCEECQIIDLDTLPGINPWKSRKLRKTYHNYEICTSNFANKRPRYLSQPVHAKQRNK